MKFTMKDKRTNLEKEIDSILLKMKTLDVSSEEYSAAADNLGVLIDAQSKEKEHRASPDTIAVILGGLLQVILMLNFEKTGVISSKALGFIMKRRV